MLINMRNALMAGKRLPYDAEVEYLESTGMQWIDTGYAPTATTKLEIDLMFTGAGTQQFGSGRSTNGVWAILFGYYHSRIAFWGGVSQVTRLSSYTTNERVTCGFSVPDQTYWIGGNAISDTTIGTSTTTVQTFALFARKNADSTFTSPCTMRVYSVKIWDNGTLRRDYIPVRKGNVGYLYDRVSGQLFGNEGSGDLVLGPDIVPVEYIESHGTEWIDTGYAFQDNFAWELTFNGLGYNQTLFGGRTAAVRTALLYQRAQSVGAETTIPIAGYNGSDTSFVLPDLKSGTHTVKAAFSANEGSAWVDGVAQYTNQSFSGTYISGVTHAVFADNFGNGDVREFANSKVYALKMWQNDTPVRSFRPVRVGSGSTWEGAMMDVLTRRIYRNAGTGAFAYGNDLKYPIPAE